MSEVEEGLFRKYECYSDVPQDVAIYGLLYREWSILC